MHTNPIRRESVICCAIASLAVASCEVESNTKAPAVSGAVSATAPEAPRSRSLDLPVAQDVMRVRLRELGMNESTLDASEVERSHRLPTGGSILQLSQRAHGVPVFRARASVTMDADQRVVAASSSLSTALTQREPTAFVLTPEQALAEFYSTRAGSPLSAADVAAASRPAQYNLHTQLPAPRALAAHAKRVYFPLDGQLIAAYHVELMLRDARGVNHAYAAVLDASGAQPLWTADLTAFEAFNYRVWAEAEGLHIPNQARALDLEPSAGLHIQLNVGIAMPRWRIATTDAGTAEHVPVGCTADSVR